MSKNQIFALNSVVIELFIKLVKALKKPNQYEMNCFQRFELGLALVQLLQSN